MRVRSVPLLSTLVLLLTVFAGAQNADTANAASAQESPSVVMTKLFPPVYPPLARQARIMGDVKIQLLIHQDGNIESAEVIDGPLLLKMAALESAKKSQYECTGCELPTSYDLTYTFALRDQCRTAPDCWSMEPLAPELRQSVSHIAITDDPTCTCDPAVRVTHIIRRSAKCLYLWRCASRLVDSH
jgi:hypothetical protein